MSDQQTKEQANTDTASASKSISQSITDQVIAAIEAGPGRWHCPWHRSGTAMMRPRNVLTGNAYQGVNILALWAAGDLQDFQSGTWGTYRQWQQLGAQVCKGQRGSQILFYKPYEPAAADTNAEDETQPGGARLIARASTVFAVEQTDAYTPVFLDDRPTAFELCERAETFFAAIGAAVRHQGASAYYSPARDEITLPPRSSFLGTPTSSNVESYYATRAHETGHWTGAPARLDRQFGTRFGDQAYAMEELTAELTAAFVCAKLEISLDPRPDHAQYLAHWLTIMRADSRALITAAAQASRAVRYMEALQPSP